MEKNIEKVEKTIIEDIVTYVSIDGMKFKTEEDCEAWEDSYKCTVSETWNKMSKYKTDSITLGLRYSLEDYTTFVVIPKTETDITALNCIVNVNGVYNFEGFSLNDIGKKFIINFGNFHGNVLFDADFVEIYDFAEYKSILDSTYEDIETALDNE